MTSDLFEVSKREKVGIALAAYKPSLDFFVSQLESIRRQTYSDWFCVISMDSDIDLSGPELRQYVYDSRFIWVKNDGPHGVVGNFQNAMMAAVKSGAHMIAFADQDDVWYPNRLERLVSELRHCRPMSLVHSDMHLFSTDSQLQSQKELEQAWKSERRIVKGYRPFHFIFRNTVTGAGSLFDSELAKRAYPIPATIEFHDHWLAILASLFGEVRAICEPLYAYRQHGSNVVGAVRFEGILYKPTQMTWAEGLAKAARGWGKRRALFQSVQEIEGARERLPSFYEKIFAPGLKGPLVLLGLSLLYFYTDPALARAFVRNGIGGLLGSWVHPKQSATRSVD